MKVAMGTRLGPYEILVRDALLIPRFHEQAYRFARPEVEGLTVSFATPTVAYESLRIRG